MDTLCVEESLVSFEEYLENVEEDQRCELQNGVLVTMPPPTYKHILVAELIQDILKNEIRKHNRMLYCSREVGIRTGHRKVRLLDVAVFEKAALQQFINKSAIFEVTPLLAVEVVSQESIQRDYRYKRSEYAAMGIEEYWIVDPLQNSVSILNLVDGFYEVQTYVGEQILSSHLFPTLAISAAQIFEQF
jgi:Uma2 family endonuclease